MPSLDGMDNSKSYLPRYLEHSKDQVQKERLPSKISGCTIYNGKYESNRKVLFYINHDIFENGSNMVITLIYLLLQEFIGDHKVLPRLVSDFGLVITLCHPLRLPMLISVCLAPAFVYA